MLAQHLSPPSENRVHEPIVASTRSDWLKRASDLFFGLTIAIIAVPVTVIAWCIVRLSSSGPGFYSQVRVGKNGRQYHIFKIRTMYHNCETISGAAWSAKNDPRVTPIGRIFRKLHIDELPQLLNVLRGDMGLVGPRPERPEFVDPLSKVIPAYKERLLVRPGVTGLAQIQLPPDTGLESVQSKIVLDCCYIENGSLWLDFRILLGTAVYLVGFSYDRVRKLMWLPNPLANNEISVELPAPRVEGPFKVMGLFPSKQSDTELPRSFSIGGGQAACSEAQ
jgi:lipopolysaccharide/colanic/teichoic acid biosynthesis glycosyltransferase